MTCNLCSYFSSASRWLPKAPQAFFSASWMVFESAISDFSRSDVCCLARPSNKLKFTCTFVSALVVSAFAVCAWDALPIPFGFLGVRDSGIVGRRLGTVDLEYRGPAWVRHQKGFGDLVDAVFDYHGNRHRTVCAQYRGIDHPNERGCCAEACGRRYCGAQDCGAGPPGKHGCCESRAPHVWCSPTQMAPCLLNVTYLSRYYSNEICLQYEGIDSRERKACCPEQCGEYCGAEFCKDFSPIVPALKAQCCTDEYSATCGPNKKAPCLLPTTTHTTTSALAPPRISYPGLPGAFSAGDGVSASPKFDSSGSYNSFTVHPQLPKDLKLDPLTGVISGVVSRATLCHPTRNYTVIAMGAPGETTTEIMLIRHRITPPQFLDYPGASDRRFSVGDEVRLHPTYIGGDRVKYFNASALSAGLALNSETGEISGTLRNDSKFVGMSSVTVANVCGNATALVNLQIKTNAFHYPGLPIDPLSAGNRYQFTSVPEYIGHRPDKFTVHPSLPFGLKLDSSIGAISGVIRPDILCHSLQTYTVTAERSSHKVSSALTLLTHGLTAPSSLRYTGVPKLLITGDRINIKPTYRGSRATHFKIEGVLPAGLKLNTSTGEITGELAITAGANETQIVEASNACGKTVSTISWAMKEIPIKLDYTGFPVRFMSHQSLKLEAVVGDRKPTHFAIHPELPVGLYFNESTGSIQGVLGVVLPTLNQTYVVGASDNIGLTTTRIKLPKQVGLDYRDVPEAFVSGQNVKISPKYSGIGSVIFTVNPELPKGLFLDSSTGEISGLLSKNFTMPRQRFVVTATSTYGTVTSDVSFAVTKRPPFQWWVILALMVILGLAIYFGCRGGEKPEDKDYTGYAKMAKSSPPEEASQLALAPVAVETSEPSSSNLPLIEREVQPWRDGRDGLALTFETELGDEVAVWAVRKPLGLVFEKRLPIVITEEGDGHASELGIELGWTLTSINDVDITGFRDSPKDYKTVSDMLQRGIYALPEGLPLTFITETGKERVVHAMRKPLGLIYDRELPILIKEERPGSHGSAIGVRRGWMLKKINNIDISLKTNFDEVNVIMHRWINKLPHELDEPFKALTNSY